MGQYCLRLLVARYCNSFIDSIMLCCRTDSYSDSLQIFTNFLSSVMINATRPFLVNEWINAKIDGVEVAGMVEVRIGMLHLNSL